MTISDSISLIKDAINKRTRPIFEYLAAQSQNDFISHADIAHKGIAYDRAEQDWGIEERRFVDAWQKSNDQGQTLAYLLDESRSNVADWDALTVRDVEVAATVIQWLGSPVGQAFLRDLGYEKKNP